MRSISVRVSEVRVSEKAPSRRLVNRGNLHLTEAGGAPYLNAISPLTDIYLWVINY